MLWRGTHRIAFAFALAAALLAPAAPLAAAGFHGPPHAAARQLDLDALWTWARLWLSGAPALPAPRKSACDAGAHIDPDGHTICKSAGASSDAGLHIDPDGLQGSNTPTGTSSDAGLHIDPNG